MRVLISAVGHRTEHWEAFFAALACNPELDVTVHAADVSPLGAERLAALDRAHDRFRFVLSPHLLGEGRTGHMASIVFRPGAWARVEDEAPDVIHVIGEPAYLATYQTIRFRNRHRPGVPITVYAAQNVVTRFPLPFPQLERYAYRQVALAFPITEAALAVLRAKGFRGPARIVPLGVDVERFRPRPAPPAGPFTVGFVGRLEPHKGVGDLLEAVDRLGCRLLAVGDGSLRPWLEDEAAKRPERIELLRWASHEELPALLARMHVLALPSVEIVQRNVLPWVKVPLREQFGRVLAEAMASGVPVAGSRVGEVPVVIGTGGLTFPPGDPTALAGVLARIRSDAALAARLAEAGIARAALLDWRRIADEVFDAWSNLVDERGEAPRRRAA